MIDTKAYRQQTVDTPHNNIAIINAMCDELDRLYLDNTPLSREELEMVLKEKCWTVSKMSEENSYCTNENKSLAINNGKIYAMQFDLSCPLSAVTRAMLRSCGVIK